MTVKINTLQVENVKRVKAVTLSPSPAGLTVIGGVNGAGKTSVLDAIAWGLGGDRRKPGNAARDGSMAPPAIHLELNNGITVERKGKNSSLTVKDPTGKRAGQKLLDEFVSQFALDLPRFMTANDADKARTLLQLLGIEAELQALEDQETRLYNERHALGQIADRKKKHAEELPYHADAPEEPLSGSAMTKKMQDALQKNAENDRLRASVEDIRREMHDVERQALSADKEIQRLKAELERAQKTLQDLRSREVEYSDTLQRAVLASKELVDEDTTELEKQLEEIDAINTKVRANLAKSQAMDEAQEYTEQYMGLTEQLAATRKQRLALIEGADLPLPELTVQNSALLYRGQPWDCMSGAEQLQVAVAIVRRLNPDCGFVLIDKLEAMDSDTLASFGEWLTGEGLQAIATRVSTGDECSIVIEDGLPQGQAYVDVTTGVPAPRPKQFTPGQF